MGKGRLEAFSDGVLAIIITIMVLELKLPAGEHWSDLNYTIWSRLIAYALSFIYIGIYWNNHHHLWHAAEKVNGAMLWANLHLLFWLSLVPLATEWMGNTHFAAAPVTAYGVMLLMSAIAFSILVATMIRGHGRDSMLAKAIGTDVKGKISMGLYALGLGAAFIRPWIGLTFYTIVALIWLIPDRRVEKRLAEHGKPGTQHHGS